MFGIYFRKEAKVLGQQGKAKGLETSQDQIFGKGTYANSEVQALYNEQILSLCHKAALNALVRIQELGKQMDSITRVKQGQRESFTNFSED